MGRFLVAALSLPLMFSAATAQSIGLPQQQQQQQLPTPEQSALQALQADVIEAHRLATTWHAQAAALQAVINQNRKYWDEYFGARPSVKGDKQ